MHNKVYINLVIKYALFFSKLRPTSVLVTITVETALFLLCWCD